MKLSKSSSKKDTKKDTKKDNKKVLKKNRPDSDDDDLYDTEDEYETISEDEDDDSSYRPGQEDEDEDEDDETINTSDEEDEDEYEDDEYDEDEYEEDGEEDVVEEVMDRHELQKFISKIFPSKYMDEKVESGKTSAKKAGDKYNLRSKNKKDDAPKKKAKSSKKGEKKSKSAKKRRDEESDDEDEDEEDDEEEYEPGDRGFENADEERGFYSIIFGADPAEDECAYIEEEEDVECDSDDERAFMKETYEKVEPIVFDDEPSEKKKLTKKEKKDKRSKKAANTKPEDDESEEEITDVEHEYLELVETKKQLIEQLRKKPKSRVLRNAVSECNRSIKKLVKKARSKNAKTYHKLIHNDKKRTNEIDYFRKKLSNKEQLKVMKDLKEINKHVNVEKPYRLRLLDSRMPANLKAIVLQKLNVLRMMEPGDNEYYKIKNWVDTFMRIPFGAYKSFSVTMDDGIEKCNEFMENAKKTLDECTYGLNDAKMQIMQFMGQWIANPGAMGSAIAIHGPPGTSKTTIIKEGISKILGREFAFIALGGAGDSSFLEGHSYTYEGSSWGKIVQILIDSKCMNPVIYFDELDKVSDTPRGEEIIGILTHLTDTSQNSQYHDKYFSEVDFDLSKCLFIFSYNDESKVNPILKDRMYRIQTKGYEAKDKVIIARDYLLPKIREQVNFKEGEVIIPDDTIQYIAGNSALTKDESGVRNLKRCLEIIHTKLNLFRLVKPDSGLFGKDMELKVSFPFTVTRKDVDVLIKNEEKQNQSLLAMYT
jgi:ATP-dependent Lon protease